MPAIDIKKYDDNPIKNERANVIIIYHPDNIFPVKSLWKFFSVPIW